MNRGPLYMILASALFTAMVTFVKISRAEMSGVELVFWRGAISVPIVLVTLRGAGFALKSRGAFALRLLFGLGAMSLFYTAAYGLELVDLNLIARLQPIFIAIAAPIVLGADEKGGRRVWLAAVGGLTGAALIMAPDLAVGSIHGLLALLATLCSSGAHLALRKVAKVDHGRTIVFWFHIGMASIAAVIVLATKGGIPLPPRHLWLPVLGIGVCATFGQLLITKAYSITKAPVAAAASYVGILWSLIADIVIFDVVPGLPALIGGAFVVVSSLGLVLERPRRATGLR